MREKTPRVVVTFSTTSDAMAMEAFAREQGLSGRVIPVPSEIDAGCGLAWCADAAFRQDLADALTRFGVAHEGLFDVMMY